MAYLELKRLERVLQDKIDARRKSESGEGQISIGFVTPQQFYGMDTNEFAVELARVTLMIARKVAIDLCDIHDQPALPLDTLDENIVCQDALFTEWVKADAIIGNPPFLGGKHMRMNLSDEYIDRVFDRFPDVKDSVDFCAYWFRLAHDQIGENGRAGLVGTNSISQGKSRIAALDYVVQNGGVIYDAISTQVWSGEANVHVSIVNWVKEPSPLAPEPSPLAPLPKGEGDMKGDKKGARPRSDIFGRNPKVRAIKAFLWIPPENHIENYAGKALQALVLSSGGRTPRRRVGSGSLLPEAIHYAKVGRVVTGLRF